MNCISSPGNVVYLLNILIHVGQSSTTIVTILLTLSSWFACVSLDEISFYVRLHKPGIVPTIYKR